MLIATKQKLEKWLLAHFLLKELKEGNKSTERGSIILLGIGGLGIYSN